MTAVDQEKLGDFDARNCAVVGVSTDTAETHQAYLRVSKDNGGIEGVTYPLVADTNKTISTNQMEYHTMDKFLMDRNRKTEIELYPGSEETDGQRRSARVRLQNEKIQNNHLS